MSLSVRLLCNFIPHFLLFSTIAAILFGLNSCANVQAPSGGPRDSTAPRIIEFSPYNYTTNFGSINQNKQISLTFDKYMDKGKVIEGLFISPETRLDFDWSGKELTISLIDTLRENTTYNLVLSTDISDYLGNKFKESYTYVFSTGDKIDKGMIKGQLYDDSKPKTTSTKSNTTSTNNSQDKSLDIFAYYLGLDSNNFDKYFVKSNLVNNKVNNKLSSKLQQDSIFKKPDYRTLLNSDGSFVLSGLREGYYLVVGVEDKLKDKVYNEGVDRLAMPQKVVYVNDSLGAIAKFKLNKTIDINAPNVVSAEVKNYFSDKLLSDKNVTDNSKDKSNDTSKIKNQPFLFTNVSVGFSEDISFSNINNYSFVLYEDSKDSIFKSIINNENTVNSNNFGFKSFLFPFKVNSDIKEKSKVELLFTEKLETGKVYKITTLSNQNLSGFYELINKINKNNDTKLTTAKLNDYIIKDTSGNIVNDSLNFAKFKLNNKIKTVDFEFKEQVKINGLEIKDSTQNINNIFDLTYQANLPKLSNDNINTTELDSIIRLYNSKTKKYENLKFIPNALKNSQSNLNEANLFKVTLENNENLQLDTWYDLEINRKLMFGDNIDEIIELNENSSLVKNLDTIIKLSFKTIKTNKTSTISGKFIDKSIENSIDKNIENKKENNQNYIIILRNEEKKNTYSFSVKNDGDWKLQNVESGTYQIEVIKDKNNNGVYDFGKSDVYGIYEFSEDFYNLEQKIKVKENWDIENIMIFIE